MSRRLPATLPLMGVASAAPTLTRADLATDLVRHRADTLQQLKPISAMTAYELAQIKFINSYSPEAMRLLPEHIFNHSLLMSKKAEIKSQIMKYNTGGAPLDNLTKLELQTLLCQLGRKQWVPVHPNLSGVCTSCREAIRIVNYYKMATGKSSKDREREDAAWAQMQRDCQECARLANGTIHADVTAGEYFARPSLSQVAEHEHHLLANIDQYGNENGGFNDLMIKAARKYGSEAAARKYGSEAAARDEAAQAREVHKVMQMMRRAPTLNDLPTLRATKPKPPKRF